LVATLARSLQADMQAELRDLERGAAAGTKEAGRGLKTELRRQVGCAGLGQRLAHAWREKLYLDGNLVASSTAANTATSIAWSIFRFGWGFSTSQDFNGDIALIACFAASWTPAMIRRWNADPFGFLRPWNEVPALIASAPPATPPSTGSGVVTFLMG
jgi:hypothetical protein